MTVYKATKKKESNGIFKATEQKSYNAAMIYGWEKKYNESYDTLEKYRKRIEGGEYLSPDDLSAYEKAMNSYVDAASNMRFLSKSIGKNDIDDKDWENSVSQMRENFKGIYDHYSRWDTKEKYDSAVAAGKEYEDKKNLNIEAAEQEIAEWEYAVDQYNKAIDPYWFDYFASEEERQAALDRYDVFVQKYAKGTYTEHNRAERDLEVARAINDKRAYAKEAKRIQENNKLGSVSDPTSEYYDPEFSQYTGYVDDGKTALIPSYENLAYDAVNNNMDSSKKAVGVAFSTPITGLQRSELNRLNAIEQMDDNQRATYNYYYNKYGFEKAEQYLDSIMDSLNYKYGEALFKPIENNWQAELLFGVASGLDQFTAGMTGVWDAITGNEEYRPTSGIQYASGMVREDMGDVDLKWYNHKTGSWENTTILGNSLGQVLYDETTTAANMAPSILASMAANAILPGSGAAVGSILMGGSAAGNAYQEMINLGYDKGQARTYATLVGCSEAGLQYLMGGVDKLGGKLTGNAIGKIVSGVDNAFARTAIKLGGNMLSEGIEEGLQEILTPWFQNLALHTDNDVNWNDVAYSSLLGALTAGFMESGGIIATEVGAYRTGKSLQVAGISGQRLAEIGQTFSADSVAYQLAGKVDENTGAYTLGRLFNEIGAELTEANKAEIAQELEKRGVSAKDARVMVDAMANVVLGGSFTDKQIAILEANDVLTKAVVDVVINPNSTVNQRSQGYKEILSDLAKQKTEKASQTEQVSQDETNTATPGTVDVTKENAAESRYEVSDDGVTFLKSDPDRAVKITGISSVENGRVMLETESGETVDAEDVSYGSQSDALVYEAVANLEGIIDTTTANKLARHLQKLGGANSNVYSKGIVQAYTYGYYGYGRNAMTGKNTLSSTLTEKQRNVAYGLGEQYRNRKTAADQAKVSRSEKGERTDQAGKVHFDGDRTALTERQRTSLDALEKVADSLRVQIYVFESELSEDGKRVGANGWYDPKDGSIHIDLHAGINGEGTMLFTAAHELTHFIRQWSPAKFKILADFLMQEYGRKGVSVDALVREQMEKAKRNGRKISYDTAYEEVVADSMETMLSDGRVAEKLAKLKDKDRTLWQKIKDFINELAAKIRSVYEGLTPDSAEGRYVADMVDSIEKLQSLFVEGLADASENYQAAGTQKNATEDGGARMQLREVNGTRVVWIEKNILKENKGQPVHQFVADFIAEHIGEVYTIIESGQKVYIGEDLPNEYTQSKYTKAILRNNPNIVKAKNRASANLGEMIEIATNRRWEKTKHAHNKDAKYGIYRYDTLFGFPIMNSRNVIVGASFFRAELLIRNASDGKKYLYDIVGIKKDTASSDWLTNKSASAARKTAGQKSDASKNNVAQKTDGVNNFSEESKSRYSLRDVSIPTRAELERKKPMKVVDISAAQTEGTFAQRRDQILKNADRVISKPYLNRDTNTLIFLTEKSYSHSFNNLGSVQLNAAEHIPELIENAVLTHAEKPTHGSDYTDGVYTFFAAARAEHIVPVKLKVKEYTYAGQDLPKNIKAYFDSHPQGYATSYDTVVLEVEGVEKSPSGSAKDMNQVDSFLSPEELSTIKVADLLNLVKGEPEKYIPKFSDRDTESVSNRSLLANAFEGVAQNDAEKQKMQEYKGKIELIESEERKLGELKQKIKELSFAKGPRDKGKLTKLQDEARKTANRINTYDKQLLRLEASKPLQDVLTREKKRAYQRAEQKGEEALAAYRDKAVRTQREMMDKWQESRKKGIDSRTRTALRHKVQSVVSELNDLLLSNDKKRHVPDSMKKAVADALSLVNMDTVGAEERIAKYAALIANETDPDKIEAYTVTMENIRRQGEKVGQRLSDLHNAYEEIQNSEDPDIANAYDPVIAGSLKELAQSIGNTPIRDMSAEQLSDVYDMYRMVLTRVRDANKAFAEGISASIGDIASSVIREVKSAGGEHTYRAAALDPVRKFQWDNLKPVYAMERLGSSTMSKVFETVRAGEDTWAKDVVDARKYYLDKSKKYGYNSWDFDKKTKFESASGVEFELSLEQILSLYAYSKREQAADHLRLGGFVFDSNIETHKEKGSKLIKYKVNTAEAHQITPDILADITSTLTPEQKAFVDEMQDYLSTVMGAKGNEVTMKMYGVKLFKEKHYFPLKSARQFMFEQNEVSGEVRIKNSGFTNKVIARANNPVILNNFMDVWSGHVNDMSMYHAFVLPLEDFNRVFNYNSPKSEGQQSVSVKGTIQNAYSPAAVSYMKQLITDLNGGVVTDPRETLAKTMIAKFKKAKVFSSASVVIQQPSAIGRAFALVDPKYFHFTKDGMKHSELWNEVKQYAPVAIIKEMGYFDTDMGRSAKDFITAKEYSGIKEKAKALFADGTYRDEVLSKAPALADEITWCAIWNAVKRETKAKNPELNIKSEELLKKAGKRFTEVITKTQVYDSVLSRSANMRSKSGLMSMATSFMAEPTTTINMIEDALIKAKRGNKKYAARAFAAAAVSILLNNALVALVYGARDDDEDETYLEKYSQAFLSNTLDDINPITYYPFLKDIWSLLQGYDVERADMSLVADMTDALKGLVKAYNSENGDIAGAWWDIAGAIANIGGIPAQNISRDVKGAINFVKTLVKDASGRDTTWGSMGDALGDAVRDSLPVVGWLSGETKGDKLYDAIVSGDDAYVDRLKSVYKDESSYRQAVRKALRENDSRIKEAAEAKVNGDSEEYLRLAKEIIAEKHFAQDDVVAAINAEINALLKAKKSEVQ